MANCTDTYGSPGVSSGFSAGTTIVVVPVGSVGTWDIGLYGGIRLLENVILDATVAHSWLDYDTNVGTAKGSFDATRLLIAANLAGQYQLTDKLLLEPAVRGIFNWKGLICRLWCRGLLQNLVPETVPRE